MSDQSYESLIERAENAALSAYQYAQQTTQNLVTVQGYKTTIENIISNSSVIADPTFNVNNGIISASCNISAGNVFQNITKHNTLTPANLIADNIKNGVTILGVTGSYSGSGGGGGSSAFDLVKVTNHTTEHAAYSAITQIIVTGLEDVEMDEQWTIPFADLNGTYLPTPQTAEETDPLKRIYKHITANRWIVHWAADPQEWGQQMGYWLFVDNLNNYSYYSCRLNHSSNFQPLATGTSSWEEMEMGISRSVTLAVTTTNYPATTFSITAQKISEFVDANYIRTYNTDGVDINVLSSDFEPITIGSLVMLDNVNSKLILPVSNTYKQSAGLLLDSNLTSSTPSIGSNWYKWYGNDSNIEWSRTEQGILGVWLNSTSIESKLPYIPKNNITIAIWAKQYDYPSVIMAIGRDEAGKAFNFYINGGGRISLTPCGDPICQASVSNLMHYWHHYAATYSNGNCILYVDGVQVATGNYTINIREPIVYVNGVRTTTGGITGNIPNCFYAGLKVYNVALTAQEIAALASEFTPTA